MSTLILTLEDEAAEKLVEEMNASYDLRTDEVWKMIQGPTVHKEGLRFEASFQELISPLSFGCISVTEARFNTQIVWLWSSFFLCAIFKHFPVDFKNLS